MADFGVLNPHLTTIGASYIHITGKVMPALLGEGFHLKEGVSQLMGVCLHVFKNKVKGQIETGKYMFYY